MPQHLYFTNVPILLLIPVPHEWIFWLSHKSFYWLKLKRHLYYITLALFILYEFCIKYFISLHICISKHKTCNSCSWFQIAFPLIHLHFFDYRCKRGWRRKRWSWLWSYVPLRVSEILLLWPNIVKWSRVCKCGYRSMFDHRVTMAIS